MQLNKLKVSRIEARESVCRGGLCLEGTFIVYFDNHVCAKNGFSNLLSIRNNY